jgi:hypothetical protein
MFECGTQQREKTNGRRSELWETNHEENIHFENRKKSAYEAKCVLLFREEIRIILRKDENGITECTEKNHWKGMMRGKEEKVRKEVA